MRRNPFVICNSLLGRIAFMIGKFKSWLLALYERARKSFGRHEPPNAKPGVMYAGEILSFLSWQKIFITSCASSESDLQRLPISFEKPIFSACQLLSTYFPIPAVARSVRMNGAPSFEYSVASKPPLSRSTCPITVFGGELKSLTAEPSRRNSGLLHTPKSAPAFFPEYSSSVGSTI